MVKSANIFYKELFRDLLKKQEKEQRPAEASDGLTADGKMQGADTFDNDLTIFCQMRDKGYKYDDIIEAIKKNSPIMERFQGKDRPFHVYIDRIVNSVNSEHLRRSSNAYPLAEKAYKLRCEALMKKYVDMDESIYGVYQDGAIAMSLMMKDGFSPEVIESVIKNNSPAQEMKEDEKTYLQTIMDGVKESSSRYRAIQNYVPEDALSENPNLGKNERNMKASQNIYCLSAQQYMEKTHTVVLSGKDDENILYGIIDYATNEVEAQSIDVPEQSRKKIIDNDTVKYMLPILRRCLIEGSPVAVEPGRDTNAYAQSILSGFEADCLQRRKQSDESYPQDRERFENIRSRLDEERQEYDKLHSPAYMDALAAKKLLEEHMPPSNILRVLKERKDISEANGYPSSDKYAEDIVKNASEALHAEREIRFFSKKIPEEKSLKELEDRDISVTDIYKGFMAQRIKENPSFSLRMSEPLADQEVVEHMMVEFRDLDLKEVEKAIRQASPRYRLPDANQEYPSQIIRQVQKNFQLVSNKDKEKDSLQQEFLRNRGLAAEGTIIPKKESTSKIYDVFNTVKDSKAAVKMLMQEKNLDDIKIVLKSLAIAGGLSATAVGLDHYVNNILETSQAVYHRQLAIANYKPLDLMASHRSASDVYLEKMHNIYDRKEFVQPSMDVRVMEEMLLSKKFSPEEIKQAIDIYSPVRAEACRDNHYMDYVEKEANANLLIEEEKLKKYQIVPRMEPESTCEDEYDYQKKRMQDTIRLPFEPRMDVKICSALVKEGFPMQDCVRSISMRSPMNAAKKEKKEEALDYGKEIMRRYRAAQQQQAAELAQMQLQQRVRVRSKAEEDANGKISELATTAFSKLAEAASNKNA